MVSRMPFQMFVTTPEIRCRSTPETTPSMAFHAPSMTPWMPLMMVADAVLHMEEATVMML